MGEQMALAAAIQQTALFSASQEELLEGVPGWHQAAGTIMDETPSQPTETGAALPLPLPSDPSSSDQRVFDVTASTTLSEPTLEPVEFASAADDDEDATRADGDSFDAAFESDRSRSRSPTRRRLSWGPAPAEPPSPASAFVPPPEEEAGEAKSDERSAPRVGEAEASTSAAFAAAKADGPLPCPDPETAPSPSGRSQEELGPRGKDAGPLPEREARAAGATAALVEGGATPNVATPGVRSRSKSVSAKRAGAEDGFATMSGGGSAEGGLQNHEQSLEGGGRAAMRVLDDEAGPELPHSSAVDDAAAVATPEDGPRPRPPSAVQEKLDRLRSQSGKRVCRDMADDLAIVRERLWEDVGSRSQDPRFLPGAVMDAIRVSSGAVPASASAGSGEELLRCALRGGVSLPVPVSQRLHGADARVI